MKNFKRMIAAAVVLIMVLSFAGCHKKNEIAVTVGDVEFTSAYYMCALINADSEAKNLVYESLTEEEQSEEIDYYSHKVEDTDYVEWVENKAMDTLEKIAAYKTLCKENEIEPAEEDITNAETYASYYWSSYGYSQYFEPNGVSEATYTQYMKDSYYAETYFEHVYGEGGEKEVAADKVSSTMLENFVLADILEGSYTTTDTDENAEATNAALKTKFEGYVKALKDGSMTYEEVYKDYNGTTDEEAEETTDEDSEELAPLDEYATLLGSEDTDYASDHFETVKGMKVGEVKLVELEDDAGLVILVKQNLEKDEYYIENLDTVVRHIIADEEFEADIEKYIDGMEKNVSKYAIGQFKVKKIIEPETTGY